MTQMMLAERIGVAREVIVDFEDGTRVPEATHLEAIRRALEAAGVEFTNGGEPGVKLKLRRGAR
jgi:predicted transcriptional regulator